MPGRGDRGGKKERPKDARGTLIRIIRYQCIEFGSINVLKAIAAAHFLQIAVSIRPVVRAFCS